jgi:RimJ/RimL family protein N-acetyltransferase
MTTNASSHEQATWRVFLDAVRETDLQPLQRWMNDLDEMSLWSGRRRQFLYEDFVRFIHERSRNAIFMVARDTTTQAPIGFMDASLREMDGIAEFQVYVDRQWRGRRSGLQAIARFLDHVFRNWPIRKVYCFVYAFNHVSSSLVESGGFELEGRFREFVWLGEGYHDMEVWSLDRQAWNEALSGSGKGTRFLRAAGFIQREDSATYEGKSPLLCTKRNSGPGER